MLTNDNSLELQSLLIERFPPIKYAFAYGSAAFPQANFDYTKSQMLDLIFIVEDTYNWHKANQKMNKRDYTGLSRWIGPSFIKSLNELLTPIHYNPFVNMGKFFIKYGVISEKDFKNDLEKWTTLLVAGRMHKPVKTIIDNQDYNMLIEKNLSSAIAVSLLLIPITTMKDKQLFETITSLSYLGDIRFSMKGENILKIKNIVEGQLEHFRALYYPIIEGPTFQNILKIDFDGFIMNTINEANNTKLIKMIPTGLAKVLGEHKDLEQTLWMKKGRERQEFLVDLIQDLNERQSKNMLLYHLVSISPFQNMKYAMKKILKSLKRQQQAYLVGKRGEVSRLVLCERQFPQPTYGDFALRMSYIPYKYIAL